MQRITGISGISTDIINQAHVLYKYSPVIALIEIRFVQQLEPEQL